MKLKVNHGKVDLKLTDNKYVNVQPKLYLDNLRIIISQVFNQYQEVHMRGGITGSIKFLDVDNEIDPMVFDENNFELIYLELDIPLGINVISESCRVNCVEPQRKLEITKRDFFDLKKVPRADYNSADDILVLKYEEYQDNIITARTEVAQDFYLIYFNEIVVGWELRNCSDYICDCEGEYKESQKDEIRSVFTQFFQLYTKHLYDKLENNDEYLKIKLLKLITLSTKHNFTPVTNVITEWLDDYYQ